MYVCMYVCMGMRVCVCPPRNAKVHLTCTNNKGLSEPSWDESQRRRPASACDMGSGRKIHLTAMAASGRKSAAGGPFRTQTWPLKPTGKPCSLEAIFSFLLVNSFSVCVDPKIPIEASLMSSRVLRAGVTDHPGLRAWCQVCVCVCVRLFICAFIEVSTAVQEVGRGSRQSLREFCVGMI